MGALPEIGRSHELHIEITADLLTRFADYSGDVNPMHFDDAYAKARGLKARAAHGLSYASFVSTLIGMHLPGPGALWSHQTLRFIAPAYVGDIVILRGEVTRASSSNRSVNIAISAVTAEGTLLLQGDAGVLMPKDKAESTANPVQTQTETISGEGPVAFIFGATGAVGSATAALFSRQGYRIGLFGRRGQSLEQLATELASPSATFVCDVVQQESVAKAVHAAIGVLGVPDSVVHAISAPLGPRPILDLTADDFHSHGAVQLGGLINIGSACLPEMVRRGAGSLTFVGTVATHGAPPSGLAAYTAAKAAAASYIRSVAQELGPQGIRANIVSPDLLETDLTNHISDRSRKLVAARSPLRRLANVEEVAEVIRFVASTQASYVSGQDMRVDGGAGMN
ncbi:MAG: SDR family oxidoreductase [Alphaproteobacteria bacterium]|nr:SDR family oxidoreductase [Alphaproteobacteria bacterium]